MCQIYIPCPNNCTNEDQGICRNDGVCECHKKFYGNGCEKIKGTVEMQVQCMNDCMGRGECNRLTGLCICDPGFGAPDCSVIEGDENELDTTILEAINRDQEND